jgi:hypothetical protein
MSPNSIFSQRLDGLRILQAEFQDNDKYYMILEITTTSSDKNSNETRPSGLLKGEGF